MGPFGELPAGAVVDVQVLIKGTWMDAVGLPGLGADLLEGMAIKGTAAFETWVAETVGDSERAFALLADARARCNRLADPYLWLEGYILDARCELGRRHGHPDTRAWVERMRNLASRTGMRELALHSLLHGAALGNDGDGATAAVLADEPEMYRWTRRITRPLSRSA